MIIGSRRGRSPGRLVVLFVEEMTMGAEMVLFVEEMMVLRCF